jgi:polysaccharide export outer membrane protein
MVTRLASALFLLAVVGGGVRAGEVVDATYALHPGDKIEVSVWKEPDLQKPLVISPDGKVSLPLAGEFTAAGKTVSQLRNEIELKLKAVITEPVVTVSIMEVAGNVAYVIGQVNKPGALVMNPRINVLQALALTGGATPFAKLDDIIVIRGAAAGQRVFQFRYGQVASGKHLEQNVILESGDVIIVP